MVFDGPPQQVVGGCRVDGNPVVDRVLQGFAARQRFPHHGLRPDGGGQAVCVHDGVLLFCQRFSFGATLGRRPLAFAVADVAPRDEERNTVLEPLPQRAVGRARCFELPSRLGASTQVRAQGARASELLAVALPQC